MYISQLEALHKIYAENPDIGLPPLDIPTVEEVFNQNLTPTPSPSPRRLSLESLKKENYNVCVSHF